MEETEVVPTAKDAAKAAPDATAEADATAAAVATEKKRKPRATKAAAAAKKPAAEEKKKPKAAKKPAAEKAAVPDAAPQEKPARKRKIKATVLNSDVNGDAAKPPSGTGTVIRTITIEIPIRAEKQRRKGHPASADSKRAMAEATRLRKEGVAPKDAMKRGWELVRAK